MLAFGDVGFVAGGVDEGVFVAVLEALVFLVQAEVAPVGAEEYVAGKLAKDLELMAVVIGDLRVRFVVDEFVAGVDIGAADDDDVEGAAVVLLVKGPGCGALGVAGGEMRSERDTAERDGVTVMKSSVDLCGGEPHGPVVGVVEVVAASRFDHGNVL